MRILRFSIIALASFAIFGCGDTSSSKALSQEETAAKAKTDLNARLDNANVPPEVKAQANQQLDQMMMSTQARRGGGPGAPPK